MQSPFTPAAPDSQVDSDEVAVIQDNAEQPQFTAGVSATLKRESGIH